MLNHLLQPILMTSAGLRLYRTRRRLPELPTGFSDEAGTLMADAVRTLTDLDAAIDELAHYDKVTGLPNRDRLLAALAERIVRGHPFLLCVVRLGNYERLASTFDQATADTVLCHIAGHLRSAAGPDAVASRVEGSIVAFILAGGADPQELAARAETIIAPLRAETVQEHLTILPELLAGASVYPEDAQDAGTLLNNALAALAEGAAAPGPLTFFSAAARDAARTRFRTEQELRRALGREEFILHFQPVVDLGAGRVVGAEALIRWRHPERGLVPPALFIPVAETSGLIEPIGLWALRAACAQLRQWSDEGHHDLKLAVNLSARQFLDTRLTALIDDTLRENRVAAGRLEIELTETTAMQDRSRTRAIFGQLRELGVSIAIDDFGTGYSSMSYLKDLPFDKLKIDREFVSGVHHARAAGAICSALIELARGLGIAVLAEGTETEEEVRHLYQQGCTLFQGFYFARPLAAAAFTDAIDGLCRGRALLSAA